MISIDKYAYLSKLNFLSPVLKVSFAIVMMALCIGANNLYISCLILLTVSYLTVAKGKVPLRQYMKLLRVPLVFLVIGVLTIIISFTREPLDLWNLKLFGRYLAISRQGLFFGISLAFKALGAVCCLYFMSLSTPVFEVVSVLNKIHLPKILTEMMLLIYRFIFILMDTKNMMTISADARLGFSTRKAWMHSTANIAGTLFIKAYKRSGDMYDAMESRCYDGSIKFLEEEKKIETKQMVLAVCCVIILLALTIYLNMKGLGVHNG